MNNSILFNLNMIGEVPLTLELWFETFNPLRDNLLNRRLHRILEMSQMTQQNESNHYRQVSSLFFQTLSLWHHGLPQYAKMLVVLYNTMMLVQSRWVNEIDPRNGSCVSIRVDAAYEQLQDAVYVALKEQVTLAAGEVWVTRQPTNFVILLARVWVIAKTNRWLV